MGTRDSHPSAPSRRRPRPSGARSKGARSTGAVALWEALPHPLARSSRSSSSSGSCSTSSWGRSRSGRSAASSISSRRRWPLNPEKAGVSQGLFGSIVMMFAGLAGRPASRHRGGRLPRGVRPGQRAQPVAQHDHPQPGGRPGGRLRHPRPELLRARPRRLHRRPDGHLGRPDARGPRAAHHDHRDRGIAARRAREHPRGGLRRGRHALGGHPLPCAARTRRPAS